MNDATTTAPVISIPRYAGLSLRTWKAVGLVALAVGAVTLPFLISNYRVFQFNMVLVYTIVLLGLNMLTGYNGQISLGHGAFYAIGAYTAAILMDRFGWPYWATLPVAGVVCFVSGFLFGLPALRLRGHYLALATFALTVSMPQILKYKHIEHWTGGVQGIVIVKPDPPFGLKITPDQWLYLFTLAILAVMLLAAWNLLRGRIGRAMVAIRDHPIAAEAMGVNSALIKTLTFGVSALYTGVAGALGAIAVQFVAPDSFTFLLSVSLLVGLVIGGVGSIPGSLVGGLFVLFVPNIAESVSSGLAGAVYGVILLLVIYVMPSGAAGLAHLLAARLGIQPNRTYR